MTCTRKLWIGFIAVMVLSFSVLLFFLCDMNKEAVWKERWVKFAFWSINIGLTAMVLISILPIGLAQTVASVKEGLWYARSAEFLHQPALQTLKWRRVIGDTIFAAGTVALAWFIFGLKGAGALRRNR
jgi:nitric oxide reductase subunit B